MTTQELLNTYKFDLNWLAERTGLSRGRLANYKYGTSNPNKKARELIGQEIHKIGKELQKIIV